MLGLEWKAFAAKAASLNDEKYQNICIKTMIQLKHRVPCPLSKSLVMSTKFLKSQLVIFLAKISYFLCCYATHLSPPSDDWSFLELVRHVQVPIQFESFCHFEFEKCLSFSFLFFLSSSSLDGLTGFVVEIKVLLWKYVEDSVKIKNLSFLDLATSAAGVLSSFSWLL